MDRILALVEGQTEESFVRTVLEPHLLNFDRCMISTLVVTKRVKDGTNFKGGLSSYARVRGDVQRLLRDSNAAMITTMFDFYALPATFPGYSSMPSGLDPYAKVLHLEQAFAKDIGDERFVPYLSLHEYETLLFADPPSAEWLYNNGHTVRTLQQACTAHFGQPELINLGQATAPSKRVTAAFPEYQKVLHGVLAARAAGLTVLRSSCPHFDMWVTLLEGNVPSPPMTPLGVLSH